MVNPVAHGGPTASVTLYVPSPDNRILVYALSKAGSEEAVLHFVDLITGKPLPETIDQARQALPFRNRNGSAVFYTRSNAQFTDEADRFLDLTIYRHHPGDDPARDVPIATAQSLGSEIGRHVWIYVVGLPDSPYVLAAANSGVSAASEWFVAREQEVLGAGPAHWLFACEAGTRYPATLITIGMNDHRVPPWMGAEMADRLQAATTSGKPVELRVDFEGGHHTMGVAKDDMAAQFADTFAFALQVAHDPSFQPKP